ncbi:YbgC/FadM family acyl-CoA thioesterase [Chitinivorax sp. B]|uniref:acyl-CoA thioesterase n=1 Tax=Chitinivorax sp. B TaxID=2502235 RepID=UPI0010F9FD1F|nr:YbgC/FadM family acyl-CoA thioesterase [Chitinivorax sp. B]
MTNPHFTHIRVRGYHLDVYGHVNNARYLEFLEEARWGYFEENGALAKLMEHDLAFVIVNININYRRSALLNETLEIETGIKALNRRNGVVSQVIRLKDDATVVSDAEVTFVLYDGKQDKAIAIEGELLATMKPYLLSGETGS